MASQFRREPLDLKTTEGFLSHPWIKALAEEYLRDSTLANAALGQVLSDLNEYNTRYNQEHNRVAFTTIEGRVKSRTSFFQKFLKSCRDYSHGLTKESVEKLYRGIKDLCGVRFSCPYYDEVLQAVSNVRRQFADGGYATDLQAEGYADRNELDLGDGKGYRSYHFFVRVPTQIDIYGNVSLCLCEIQARTELQHVWAVKSHNLLYKPGLGWDFSDSHVIEDMKQLSNSLRSADQFLMSVRDRVVKNR
jgi:ppGpp synthetase/RelA/SpoT-type nucleotidyltranferase